MCAQLYIQRAAQPDTWVMSGAPAATAIWLSRDTPINYSDGTTDTLPANTPAVLPGGGTSFDRTHDVFVPYTVKGSGVLSIIKESLLPTLTDDYAPLARVELHAIKPYQPEPYLAAGGLGTFPASTTTLASTVGAERIYDLGNSGGYLGEPAGWHDVGFDDSAWPLSILEVASPALLAGAQWVSFSTADVAGSEIMLLRRDCVLPPGVVQSATLQVGADAEILGVWVNGTVLFSGATMLWPFGSPPSALTVALPVADLLPGAANVLALKVRNGATTTPLQGPMGAQYLLTVASGASSDVIPSPGGTEGDLLYYHAGAWRDLPIGTSGQELTVVAGDPAWTDQPADVDTSGTVTSVAFSGPTGTTTSGSPLTTSGTISLSWASQSANVVLAAPNGSSGAPTFRALVGADIPVDASTIVSSAGTIKGNYQAGSGVSISGNTISATGSGGSVTSVALTLPSILSVSGSPITTSGTLAVTLATQSAGTVFAGPSSGSAATPTFRALGASDLPAGTAAGGHLYNHGHFH